MRGVLFIVCLSFALTMAACQASSLSSLDGSIKEVCDVEFKDIEITLFADGLEIKFLKFFEDTSDQSTVLQLSISTELAELNTTDTVTLAAIEIDEFVLERDASGDVAVAEACFPGVSSGSVNFSALSTTEGNTIAGDFSLIFVTGLTLFGDFEAPLLLSESL